MHIICRHCTTSYAIDPKAFGAAGRTVRCSRCKEVWLALPEDAVGVHAAAFAAGEEADADANSPAQPGELGQHHTEDHDMPVVDSPSISSEWPAADSQPNPAAEADWSSAASHDAEKLAAVPRSWIRRLLKPSSKGRQPGRPLISLPIACTAMGALALALMIWRVDVVRLLPQTAAFYKIVGIDVNLRGLAFKDMKLTTETVDGKPVLVIEGVVVGVARKPIELPRLRFVVRDSKGTEIYAWNAILEQPALQPGEKAWFRSRLASPPAEAHDIDVRFFSRRDIAGGRA